MTCPKCGGLGYIPRFKHIDGGHCFKCDGSGELRKAWVPPVYDGSHPFEQDLGKLNGK